MKDIKEHLDRLGIDYEIVIKENRVCGKYFKIDNNFYFFGRDIVVDDYTMNGYYFTDLSEKYPMKCIHGEIANTDKEIFEILKRYFKPQQRVSKFEKIKSFLILIKANLAINSVVRFFNCDEHYIISEKGRKKLN